MSTPQTLDLLDDPKNDGYGQLPIPAPLDDQITALLESSDIQSILHAIEPRHYSTLEAYGERMASLAVREGDVSILRNGLLAVALAGLPQNRDAYLLLPLFHDAAGLIGVEPPDFFGGVAQQVEGPTGRELLAFLQRSDYGKSPASMGYRAGRDEQGFRYERTW